MTRAQQLDRSMTRQQWHALRRAIAHARIETAKEVRLAEYADSPSWAMREQQERGDEIVDELMRQLPKPANDDFWIFMDRRLKRRAAVLKRVRERQHAARRTLPRLEGESTIDWVCRRTGFVRDTCGGGAHR